MRARVMITGSAPLGIEMFLDSPQVVQGVRKALQQQLGIQMGPADLFVEKSERCVVEPFPEGVWGCEVRLTGIEMHDKTGKEIVSSSAQSYQATQDGIMDTYVRQISAHTKVGSQCHLKVSLKFENPRAQRFAREHICPKTIGVIGTVPNSHANHGGPPRNHLFEAATAR